jgi:hypothetical protein
MSFIGRMSFIAWEFLNGPSHLATRSQLYGALLKCMMIIFD